MNPLIRFKQATPRIIVILSMACFASWPAANACGVTPAPDGGYPGGNTAEGDVALFSLTAGTYNTALGNRALFHNTTGSYNTGEGFGTLFFNTANSFNTAIGAGALLSNIADGNTAAGAGALLRNTTGDQNCAFGYFALGSNNTATHNSAFGYAALTSNTTGADNTAVGAGALASVGKEARNTGVGSGALMNLTDFFGNPNGGENTAIGYHALYTLGGVDPGGNTAVGAEALANHFFGSGDNTAIGARALVNIGVGGNNIALGANAGANLTGDLVNNIDIGNEGVDGDSNTIQIGTEGTQTATYIAGVWQQSINVEALPVYVDATGKFGTKPSSRRFKKDIKPMDKTSEAILALKPVEFHYKSDKTNRSQFGLIAEDVAEVSPDLVVRDKNGEVYTVRYDQVNAMLLNEFLKEHRITEKLKATVAQQQRQIDALTAGLQKVSAQIQLNKSAPQTVKNKD